MNILLSRILKYLNGTLFLDDAYRFCVFFILHYQNFGDYSLEEVANELKTTPESILNFLKTVDVLIDGRFILEEKSLNIAFRGSKNQRIIDVQKSLKENKVCIIKKYDIKEPLVLNMREQYLFI